LAIRIKISTIFESDRLERDFHEEIYEAHRVDALAMERLTKSPFVIDVYSYCGQTGINEYATFGDDMHIFRDFTKELRTKTGKNVLKLKLEVATMIAEAVQHVHEIDGVDNATMVHYDINPSNVVITHGGIPKLNDFNVAHLFYWDSMRNERCPFNSHLSTPWWRAPEEMEVGNTIDGK
jgi:serine/threonine protein kinase